MRYIKVPETVTLTNPETGEPIKGEAGNVTVSFEEFLCRTILVDAKFGKSAADIFAAIAVREAVKSHKPGEVMAVDSAYWDKLVEVVREPSAGYNPIVVSQLGAFLKAILDATETAPAA